MLLQGNMNSKKCLQIPGNIQLKWELQSPTMSLQQLHHFLCQGTCCPSTRLFQPLPWLGMTPNFSHRIFFPTCSNISINHMPKVPPLPFLCSSSEGLGDGFCSTLPGTTAQLLARHLPTSPTTPADPRNCCFPPPFILLKSKEAKANAVLASYHCALIQIHLDFSCRCPPSAS